MATLDERIAGLADALVNRAATSAEKAKLIAAFSMGFEPEATNAQRARETLRRVRKFVTDEMDRYDAAQNPPASNLPEA